MKRKLSVIVLIAMLAVVCLGALVACKAGLDNDTLTILLNEVKTQANRGQGKASYTLDRTVKLLDSNDKEITCAVDWDTDNEGVTLSKGSETVDVTVGAGVTVYNLIGTLVNGSGKAYDVKGNPVYVPILVSGGSNQGNQGGNNQGGNNQGGNNQGGSTTKTVKEQFLSQVVTAPQAGTNYALAMYYGVPDAVYYAKATVTSYKLDSTTAASEAAVATVEATSNGYYIKLGGKYLNITSRTSGSKTYYNISLDAAATTVFTIDSNGVLLGAVDEDTYYIGTYQNGTSTQLYTAMGASWSGHLTSEGNTIDVNQFPVRLIPSNATISGGNQGGTTTGGTITGGTTTGGTTTTTPDGTSVSIDLTGKGVSGTGTALDGAITLNVDISVTCDKGSGSIDPKYYPESLRLYGGNTMTITAASGKTIKSIVFTFGANEKTNEITTDVGSFSTDTWTGSASSVVFSVATGSGNRRIASITVVYA